LTPASTVPAPVGSVAPVLAADASVASEPESIIAVAGIDALDSPGAEPDEGGGGVAVEAVGGVGAGPIRPASIPFCHA
jgi:hypothetical protein